MKQIVVLLILFSSLSSIAQTSMPFESHKGQWFFYWGWNREWFSTSDIHFQGTGFDFTLTDVKATDKPADFDIETYFSPEYVTVPQYNFRIGYFIKDHYTLSFMIDHMKYVVTNGQTVKINGTINTGNNYLGNYSNNDILLSKNFLEMEHTDGLNYGQLEIARFDDLLNFKKFTLSVTEGIGAGVLFPKTDVILLRKPRHDKYHVSGFGTHATLGLRLKWKKHFFIQSEFKAGYINMPNILITSNKAETASQSFFFRQFNASFGFIFK